MPFSMEDVILKRILATIVYYDIFNYPLTSFEIWKYLLFETGEQESGTSQKNPEKVTLAEALEALENKQLKKRIEEYQGFYFLKGRKELVRERLKNNKISEIKYKKIIRALKFLKYCPFLRMIAVTGTVAMKNAERKSDLDFLIVFKSGRIFTGRLLFTFLVHIMKMRRYGKKITDRICLNHFITDDSLEIGLKDLFASSEYSFILPVYGADIFKKFQSANVWIGKYLVNHTVDQVINMKIVSDSNISRFIRSIGENIFSIKLVEKLLGRWQIERIARDPRTHKNGSIIIADEEALVFLPEPQGSRIGMIFKDRITLILAAK
jgi:hypothetical protein